MSKVAIQLSFIAMVAILKDPTIKVECSTASLPEVPPDGSRLPAPTRFFWHPADDGGYIPAFLEGGPKPKAGEGDIRFFLYTL